MEAVWKISGIFSQSDHKRFSEQSEIKHIRGKHFELSVGVVKMKRHTIPVFSRHIARICSQKRTANLYKNYPSIPDCVSNVCNTIRK